MEFWKATDEQLETIFNFDDSCPNNLLVGVVTEMMKRKLFDRMIIKVAKTLMGTYNRDEVIQAAYIGIYQLAKIFKQSKLTFKQMVYIVIERRLKSVLAVKYQKKNFMNQQALQHEVPEIEEQRNVEQVVIRKLTLQEKLAHLSEKQRNIVTLFLEGYSLRWIGQHVYGQDTSAIRYQFKDALRRMGIQDYKISERLIGA